jgi:hypothetical protein
MQALVNMIRNAVEVNECETGEIQSTIRYMVADISILIESCNPENCYNCIVTALESFGISLVDIDINLMQALKNQSGELHTFILRTR